MSNYQVKKTLSLPPMSIKGLNKGDTLVFLCNSDIRTKQTKDEKTGELKDLHTIEAVNLDTGEDGELVLPIIPYNALMENFGGKVTGKAFAMTKGTSNTGQATKWKLQEIAV